MPALRVPGVPHGKLPEAPAVTRAVACRNPTRRAPGQGSDRQAIALNIRNTGPGYAGR